MLLFCAVFSFLQPWLMLWLPYISAVTDAFPNISSQLAVVDQTRGLLIRESAVLLSMTGLIYFFLCCCFRYREVMATFLLWQAFPDRGETGAELSSYKNSIGVTPLGFIFAKYAPLTPRTNVKRFQEIFYMWLLVGAALGWQYLFSFDPKSSGVYGLDDPRNNVFFIANAFLAIIGFHFLFTALVHSLSILVFSIRNRKLKRITSI